MLCFVFYMVSSNASSPPTATMLRAYAFRIASIPTRDDVSTSEIVSVATCILPIVSYNIMEVVTAVYSCGKKSPDLRAPMLWMMSFPSRLSSGNIYLGFCAFAYAGGLMGSNRVELILPMDLNKRLEDYINKHYRAYITARGIKAEILTKALEEWLDRHEG